MARYLDDYTFPDQASVPALDRIREELEKVAPVGDFQTAATLSGTAPEALRDIPIYVTAFFTLAGDQARVVRRAGEPRVEVDLTGRWQTFRLLDATLRALGGTPAKSPGAWRAERLAAAARFVGAALFLLAFCAFWLAAGWYLGWLGIVVMLALTVAAALGWVVLLAKAFRR